MTIRMLAAAGLAALAFTTAPARAQERPLFNPTRDVAVTYQVSGTGPVRRMTMYFAPSLHMMRVNGMGPGYMIVDHAKKETILVMPPRRMVMVRTGFDPWAKGWRSKTALNFTRAGSAVVAGVGCTLWHVTTQGHQGEACVTADGLPLRMISRGHKMEAVSVTYGPQPPALFAVPPGYRTMVAPPMPNTKGGMPGGAPGMGAP